MDFRPLRTALVVLAAAALSACGSSGSSGSGGSSGDVTASQYVKAICTAVGPFEKDVAARSNALNSAKLTSASQGKKAVQGFLTAVSADTDQALSKLQAAGTPNVANGKTISSTIVSAFTQLKNAIGSAVTQANNLSTSSPQAFQKGATRLGGTVQSSLGGISSSLGKLKSADLEKAAANEPACKALNGA
jgi:type IV pilus biogenesis protein CpaD/CtpE